MSLIEQNPWWRNPESIHADRQIVQFEKSKVQWIPRLKHFFDLESHNIYTLRGPRQVGKTTLLKLIIKEMLEKGVSPRRLFYYSCDLVEGPSQLVEIIQQYLESTDFITEYSRYIFLDEVSAIQNWQRGVKHLVDLGKLVNATVIMTGSHSLDIRKASETLPGRRGNTTVSSLDKVLLPMKFSEYVDTKDPELERVLLSHDLRKQDTRIKLLESLQKGEIPKTIKEINLFLGDLNKHWDNYLLTGGIVRAINDQGEYGEISDGTYSTYLSVTRGDILRYGKNEAYMVQLLVRLFDTLCSQVSWRTLQKNTDMGSPNTIAEYVDVLKASYVVNPVYALDINKGRPIYGKDKKIHFTDPFIFHTLRAWVKQTRYFDEAVHFNEGDEVSKLVECVVGDHLTRLAYTLHPLDGFDASNHVFYWKDSRGELDFVLRYGEDYMPFEVKYTSSVGRGDLNGLYRFTRNGFEYKGILVTRDVLKTVNGVTAVPASILLLLV